MKRQLKAIILGAGRGTRMKSSLPKVLHQIFSKTLIGWVIDAISALPYETENIAVIGHGASEVEEYLNNNYKYTKAVLQQKQLGTGHAVAQAVPLLHGYCGDVLIVCGDTPLIKTRTLNNLINYHLDNNSDLTVMTTMFDDPTGYGRIIRNTSDEIVAIVEQKDATEEQQEIKEINTGIYLLNWNKLKSAFSELKNDNSQCEYYLTDIVKWARYAQLRVLGYVAKDNLETYGINSRKNLATVSKIMKDRYLEELMDNGVTIVDPDTTFISPETKISSDTIIYPNTFITGKNKIASNCKIGPMTHIRGNCIIEECSKIGNFVELKNAHIAKNTNVCHLTYIGDADIGSHVNIGAGTICANYNSITKEKNRTTVKDNASIGSNSVLVAPVEIGKNAFVAAMSCVTKNVSPNSLAITRGQQKEIKDWVKTKKGEK